MPLWKRLMEVEEITTFLPPPIGGEVNLSHAGEEITANQVCVRAD
jgi:hypothetical protein